MILIAEVKMKQINQKYNKNIAAIIIILALSSAVLGSHFLGLLDYVENKLYDFRITVFTGSLFASVSRSSDDIIMVLLDQDSIDWAHRERGWGWPWPRKAYAEFLDYMNIAGPKSVTFDVIFSEPSIYRNSRQDEIIDDIMKNLEEAQAAGQPGSLFMEVIDSLHALSEREDDLSFAKAAEDYGNVVQAAFFSNQSGNFDVWPRDLNTPLFKTENFGSFLSSFDLLNDASNKGKSPGAQLPIKELRDAARVIGAVTGQADSDHIYRRIRLFSIFDGKAVPSLAAASFLASGYDEVISYDPQKKTINWGEYKIPVDDEGKTLLRFRGPLDRYHPYSMSSILESAEEYAAGRDPSFSPENFTDSFVFVGFYAPGLFDIFPTPVDSAYPGMGVHATLLDNMLMGDLIAKAPDWVAALIIVGAIILVVLLASFAPRISFTVAGLVISFTALIVAGFIAFYAGWWIPIAAPAIAVVLAFLTATLYSYATECKDKRFIKNAFSRILSPKVIDQIIADPSQLKLGGERRKMTAIFTDIQRFSSISSELQDEYGENGPKVLVNLLNLYLTEMSNIVLANGGTIDKYEGDAIIAFFGAPALMEDHAAKACLSAIQMKRRELELVNNIMKPEGEFHTPLIKLIQSKVIRKERPLYTRLGINTGDMVVGFMGTPAKMDYTIMGNAVNLAARLEGVNKQYDTKGILISEYTKDQIGDNFIVRPLSRVTVVGIPVPLRLYELLETKADASLDLAEMVKIWEEAFKLYETRDFARAKNAFDEVYKRDGEDEAAKLYLGRCEKYLSSPPPESWDGVDNLTEK
jgi:class 3 adenylate cyclase/CHASE2 domain-containing sensor protein